MLRQLLTSLFLLISCASAIAIPHDVPTVSWRPEVDLSIQESARFLSANQSISSLFSRVYSDSFLSDCNIIENEISEINASDSSKTKRLRSLLIKYGFDPLNILSREKNERYSRTIKDSLILIHGIKNRNTPEESELITVDLRDKVSSARVVALALLLKEFQITPIHPIHFLFLTGEKEASLVFKKLLSGKKAPVYSSNTVLSEVPGGPYVNFIGTVQMRVQIEPAVKWKSSSREIPAQLIEQLQQAVNKYQNSFQKNPNTPYVSVTSEAPQCTDSLLSQRCFFDISIRSRSRLTLSDTQGEVLALIDDTYQKRPEINLRFPRNIITLPTAYNKALNRSVIAWSCTHPDKTSFISARYAQSTAVYTARNGIPSLSLNLTQAYPQKSLCEFLQMILMLSGVSFDEGEIAPLTNLSVPTKHTR